MLFINYNCLQSPEKVVETAKYHNCLVAAACLMVSFIPAVAYIVARLTSKETVFTLDNAHLAGLWAKTTATMNSTFNYLIFFSGKTKYYVATC